MLTRLIVPEGFWSPRVEWEWGGDGSEWEFGRDGRAEVMGAEGRLDMNWDGPFVVIKGRVMRLLSASALTLRHYGDWVQCVFTLLAWAAWMAWIASLDCILSWGMRAVGMLGAVFLLPRDEVML